MSDSDEPLPDDLALCHEIIRQQADTIRESQRRIEQLEHQVEQLLRRQYGPRRESVDPDQLRLFADEEPEDSPRAIPARLPSHRTRRPSRRRWRRRGRQRLPEHLPRERIEYELTAEELACPDCGCVRMKIGEEVSEQLEYVPASMRVLQHVRFPLRLSGLPGARRDRGQAAPADRQGAARPRAAGPDDHQQVRRPPAAVPARGHLRPPRRGAVAGHALRLDGLLRRAAHPACSTRWSSGCCSRWSSIPTTPRCRCGTRRCRTPAPGGSGSTSGTSAIPTWSTTTRRGGRGTGRRRSSRDFAATSRPTRSPATTGSAPARA